MKKILVLALICIGLLIGFTNTVIASDVFSTAWKLTNNYGGLGAGHGLWRANDTTFFTCTFGAGNLYKIVFTSNTTLTTLTTNTWGVGTAMGTGSTNGARGITVTPDGYVVVADNLNNRLYSWDQNFTPYKMGIYNTPASTNGRIYGISSDSAGHIFVNYYIFYANMTSIGHHRVEVYAHPNTWTGTLLTPLQSFDVDTAVSSGYIWEGSVAKQDASAVYISTRGINKIYKYSGSIAGGYSPDPIFTTIHPHNVPDLGAYGFRNIALTSDESRLLLTYNSDTPQSSVDTTGVYIADAVYGDLLPTSSILTNGNNYLSPSRAQTLANDTEMLVISVFDSPIMRLQRAMTLVPNTILPTTKIWANETTIQFSKSGGDGSANYSLQVIAGTASLSSSGLFTPTGRGRAIVVVQDTSTNLDSSNSIPIKQVTISPVGPLILNPTAGVTLTAGGDGTAPYTWQVSDPLLGTISNITGSQAQFTAGVSFGVATVYATDTNNHKSAPLIITITPTSAPLIQDNNTTILNIKKDVIRFDLFE